MNELTSVTSAQEFRQLQDRIRRNDEVRGNREHWRTAHFLNSERQNELIDFDAQLREKRVQDRRDTIELKRQEDALYRDRQNEFDRTNNDDAFVRSRNQDIANVNAYRDYRELTNSMLMRDIADSQNNADRLLTLDKRNEDFREHEIERDARIVARQIQERADSIRQKARMRLSVDRALDHVINVQDHGQNPRGSIIDVVG